MTDHLSGYDLYGDREQPKRATAPHHYRITVEGGDHYLFLGNWADVDLHAAPPVFIECQGGALVNLEYVVAILPIG